MKNIDIILAATGPEVVVNNSETMGVVVVGFLFVMIVLSLLAMVTATIGAFFSAYATRDAAKTAAYLAANPPADAAIAADDQLDIDADPALVAVLAAAVHFAIGERPHRITSIRRSAP